jgi:hypothetical protein
MANSTNFPISYILQVEEDYDVQHGLPASTVHKQRGDEAERLVLFKSISKSVTC